MAEDYVFRSPDSDEWEVRITIPGMDGLVQVITKLDLTMEEILKYYVADGFKPVSTVINYFVEEIGSKEPVTSFDPPMVIEAIGQEHALGYVDLNNEELVRFSVQGMEGRTTWAKTSEWAEDPQVIWGE